MTKVLASALKVIFMIFADQRIIIIITKGTKLKRLRLGQLLEEEENLDERLVKEAREAIGYLQLDLPAQNRESDSDSEVSVEDGNVAKKT